MRSLRPLAFLLLCLGAAAPGLGAAPAAKNAAAEEQAGYHLLQPGETIYSVARKYSVSAESIIAANGIADPTKVKAGQKLLIPFIHVVQKGETLYGIAKLYGLSVDELRAANAVGPQATLRVGDSLLVPGAKAPLAAQGGASQGDAAQQPAAAAKPTVASSLPTLPAVIKTQERIVDPKVSWPCAGEASYLDGKAQGVIIRSKLGEAQKAVASGKVVAAGPFRGYGEMAIVMSRTGYLYVYAGNQDLSVRIGDTIGAGQAIGRVGLDAKEGSPIAFFMVYRGREAIDPALAPRD